MISFEKAQQIVLEHVPILESVNVRIRESSGMVLADDVFCDNDIPSDDLAGIEGIALRSVDVVRCGPRAPVNLILDGEVRLGERWDSVVHSGHAVKVDAGTPLPDGADTIIPMDNAVRENAKKVKIYKPEKPGEHVVIRGGDMESGNLIFTKGKTVVPSDLAVLAAIGKNEVVCYRRPKVAYLASGNDLIPIEHPPELGKYRAASTLTLMANLTEYGAEPIDLGIYAVNPDDLKASIDKARQYDMLIVSSGSSLADFDSIKAILQRFGMDLKFWKVAIRPGKPMIFGSLDNIPVFCISGNHLASLIILEQFVRPAILKMKGRKDLRRTEIVARLLGDIKAGGGITHFIRAQVRITEDGILASPDGSRFSSSQISFSTVNGFIVVPDSVNQISAGENVKVQIIRDFSDMT